MNINNIKKNNHKAILLLIFLQFVCVNSVYAVDEINKNDQDIMLQGYDVVSYFQGDTPKIGSPQFQSNYQGGVYFFVSAENKDKFIANAQQYAPAYGSYCSYGVRMGQKLAIDPLAWKIVNGTLYFQLNQGTRTIWNKSLAENIVIADRIWPKIRSNSATK